MTYVSLVKTVTLQPNLSKKPAFSKVLASFPTIKVLPGYFFIHKISSVVIQYSLAPGILGSYLIPYGAMRILSAVIICFSPELFDS